MHKFEDCSPAEARRLSELLEALRFPCTTYHTLELFREYIEEVDSIFQFRFFAKESYYELVEITVTLMNPILEIPRGCFASDGPSITMPVGTETPDFTLKLDRSDAKFTLANIKKDRCVVHATWDFSRD